MWVRLPLPAQTFNTFDFISPEKARVFVAEDNLDIQKLVNVCLRHEEHVVVLSAKSLPEAIEVTDKFIELGVEVALVDGNLGSSNDGEDGRSLVKHIRQNNPGVKIVGIGSETVDGVDVNVVKPNFIHLSKEVTNL